MTKKTSPKASYGYGGKFGVQEDRKDKVINVDHSVCYKYNITCVDIQSYNSGSSNIGDEFYVFLKLYGNSMGSLIVLKSQ